MSDTSEFMSIAEQQTILIVDDKATNLELLMRLLRIGGDYNILKASDGKTALEIARNNNIDLVILDIMMPELDGYQVCMALKEMPEKASVPVIFLTAKYDLESMIKGFNVGAVDYMTKPINVDELKVRVTTHLKLRKQEMELKQNDDTKNRFIAIVADDLRTPIKGLKSFLKMIDESSDTLDKDALNEYISVAYSAADCLDAISLNLMMWAALQNNELPANPHEVYVMNIFNDIIDEIQIENKQKDIAIINDINESRKVYVDEEYLRIIIRNVLSNAFSFSHKGGSIRVSVESQNIDTSLTFTVQDHGIGMNNDEIQNIFKPGKHHRKEGTSGETGTGMGLILCHDLLEKSNGHIWIENNIDEGVCVFINLPQDK